jgi:hypothetical protein
VWETTSTNLLVFVYDIQVHTGSHPVTAFLAEKPPGIDPIVASLPGLDTDNLINSAPGPGLGYIAADTGSVPFSAGISGGDLQWFFGAGPFGAPIPAGGESRRFYAVFDAGSVGIGTGELRDGIAKMATAPVPIAAVAAPEPTSLLLFGSGLLGLGFLVARKGSRRKRGIGKLASAPE